MSEPLIQDSLVILKPDALARRLMGRTITRLEEKEIDIVAMKMLHVSTKMAEQLYHQHLGKYFYPRLIRFITSGPVLAMVCRGRKSIDRIRQLIGDADPDLASLGTIRGDYAMHQTFNLIHASDSLLSAAREIPLFFSQEEFTSPLTPQFPWHSYPEISEF